MLAKVIASALYYGLGVGSAVLAMVTVLPTVRIASGERATPAVPAAVHALMVEESCPGVTDAGISSRCPYAAARAGGCPYLAALAAGSACPALEDALDATSCPFLNGRGGADGPRQSAPDDRTPAPEASGPAQKWMPDGTVLALGTVRDSDDELL